MVEEQSLKLNIRPMRMEDLSAVFALQCQTHTADYQEPVRALASRLKVAPQSCFVAQNVGPLDKQSDNECSNPLIAYVFAHPWAGHPPILHKPLPECPEPDHLFIHDLAVCSAQRGLGVAQDMLREVRRSACRYGYCNLRLVALRGAQQFWGKYGFQPNRNIVPGGCYGDAICMDGFVD